MLYCLFGYCFMTLLTSKCSTKKQSSMAGNLDDVLSVPQPLNQFHETFHGLIYYMAWKLSPDWV